MNEYLDYKAKHDFALIHKPEMVEYYKSLMDIAIAKIIKGY